MEDRKGVFIMMKKRFKIYYPDGHELAGKRFKVKKYQSIVMTGGGILWYYLVNPLMTCLRYHYMK